VLEFGKNDQLLYPSQTDEFIAYYDTIIDSIVNYKGWGYDDIYICNLLPSAGGTKSMADSLTLVNYNKAIDTVAARNGVTRINLFYTFETKESTDSLFYMTGIHPNNTGHAKIAEIINAYIRGWNTSQYEP